MGSHLDQFDAPELKTAVKRLYGDERAPAGLRGRVESILRADQPQSRSMKIDRATPWRWAIAAAILLGLTGLIFRAAYERTHPIGGQTLLAMVQTHDRCTLKGNKHRAIDIPQDSFALMGQSMAGRIKEPVLAASMEGGWNFVGGAMCLINGKPCAHLIYSRNGQSLSIFSIPAAYCEKVRDGAMGREVINDHMVAAFAKTGGVYCMVGSCPQKNLQLEEIQQLLKKHQMDLVAPRNDSSLAMVELIHRQ